MKKHLILSLLAAVVQISCTHYYYVANVQNVPMLQEKNDLQVSGYFGGWDESKCIELQTAFAPAENIGVLANERSCNGRKNRYFILPDICLVGIDYFKDNRLFCICEAYLNL